MISSPNDSLTIQQKNNILRITLNRSKQLNALNLQMVHALKTVSQQISGDKTIRCVIVAGSGEHFMAGGDIHYFKDKLSATPDKQQLAADFKILLDDIHVIISNFRNLPQPIIAEVSGAVAGAGFSLMMACDLIIASETAFFTLAYRHLGVSPDGGSTYALPRIVGQKRAFEIALLGDRFDAKTAERWGLINCVVEDHDLTNTSDLWAGKLVDGPVQALTATKKLLNASHENNLHQQLDLETKLFCQSSQTNEFEEGVAAFTEKRKPVFKD